MDWEKASKLKQTGMKQQPSIQIHPLNAVKRTFAQETCVELCGDQLNPAGAKVPVFATKWVVFDEIQQKIVLLSEHDRKMRKKEMKWNTCQDNKKLIMDAVHRQLDMIRNQNWNLRTDTPHRVALMVI